jgi:hypothetical protein
MPGNLETAAVTAAAPTAAAAVATRAAEGESLAGVYALGLMRPLKGTIATEGEEIFISTYTLLTRYTAVGEAMAVEAEDVSSSFSV